MIVVQTSTSYSPSHEVEHDLLERAFVHLPVRDGDARLGNELAQVARLALDVGTRLCTKNTWPSRSSSRRIASDTARSSYSPT